MGVKVTSQDIQRAVVELNLIEQILRDLQARLVAIESSVIDHERSLMFIDELTKSGEVMNVLMPIGAGGLIEASVAVRDRVKVNVGQGVVIETTLERGRGIINRRKEMLEQARAQLIKDIQEYSQRSESLRRFLSMVEEAMQRKGAQSSG